MTNRSVVPTQYQSQPQLATERQIAFISDLMSRKNLFAMPDFFEKVNAMDSGEYAAYIETIKATLPKISKKKASEMIERLLALPNDTGNNLATATAGRQQSTAPEPETPVVPDGHYALEFSDDALNPIRFYHVNKGKDHSARGGRDWSNFTFVDRYVSDDTFPVKGAERVALLERIAADPLAAAQLYGRESKRCCLCNRKLTRKLSRELGIGPVCGGRHEWLTETLITEARERIVSRGENPDEEVDQTGEQS